MIKEGEPLSSVTQGSSSSNQNVIDNINSINSADAWEVEQVFSYLHRLVKIGTQQGQERPAYQYLGIFASVALSRLECLLGDYVGSLQALAPISESLVVKTDGPDETAVEVIQSVFLARLIMAYHAGISFMMLRRYKDASRIWGDVCAFMQRGFKVRRMNLIVAFLGLVLQICNNILTLVHLHPFNTLLLQTGQLRKLPHSDQFSKMNDRMIALLAIVTSICPPSGIVEESVLRTIREKHGSSLSKIDAGEGGYDELFLGPKFVTVSAENVFRAQMKQFTKEMAPQAECRKLRSYLKLYTSIAVSKIAKFNDQDEDALLSTLIAYKHRMLQLEAAENDPFGESTLKSALDIHFYFVEDTVRVDEAEKQRRFEKYFAAQIAQNSEILSDTLAIDTNV